MQGKREEIPATTKGSKDQNEGSSERGAEGRVRERESKHVREGFIHRERGRELELELELACQKKRASARARVRA